MKKFIVLNIIFIFVFILLGFQQRELSKEDAELAIKANPEDYYAQNVLGEFYYAEGDYFKAMKYFEKAVSIYPGKARFHQNLGKTYYKLGLYDLSVKEFKEAIDIKPDDAFSYSMLAWSNNRLNQYQDALDAMVQYQKLRPEDAKTHCFLAKFYEKVGKKAMAEQELKQCPDYNPKNKNKKKKFRLDGVDKFWNYYNSKKYKNALKYIVGYIKANTPPMSKMEKAEAYKLAGKAAMRMDDYKSAAKYYDKVLKFNNMDAEGYAGRGKAYKNLDKIDEAVFDFEMAVMLDASDKYSHRDLAWLYNKKGQTDMAIGEFENVVKFDPNDGKSWKELGALYRTKRLNQKSIDAYKKALNKNLDERSKDFVKKGLAKSYFYYARELKAKGKIDDAIKYYQLCIKTAGKDQLAKDAKKEMEYLLK